MKRMTTFIATLVIIYLAFAGFLYLFQEQFVFHPSSAIHSTPADVGLPYEEVTVTTQDGIDIAGWFIPHPDARAVILYFHGNANNLADRVEYLKLLHSLRVSIFGIDYRGYGKSDGKPDARGTYKDAEAAWEYLVNDQNIAPENIVIYGRSLGGAIATWLARQKNPGALILGSSFTSAGDMARKMFPFMPVKLLVRVPYNTLEHLKYVDSPVLVSHSIDDTTVPFEHGKRLFEAANPPKEFLELRGPHNNVVFTSRQQYLEGLDSFLSRYAAQMISEK
ncbi:MAG: alpha/beta fold hydrolase [Candidatus Marinimicrobia bacterium]|nr:alpha/beta fold hydrolase [Candidatus Neomarinimicrobiota bacterium]MCF7828657.1 alpha/beta fold hydrolase [Candidatus Neomarinimicrobiota bacterium]MCF7880398.1 alpha/beta fold hydrolase [Candidatus Neomarinimicrobiota bacterium]